MIRNGTARIVGTNGVEGEDIPDQHDRAHFRGPQDFILTTEKSLEDTQTASTVFAGLSYEFGLSVDTGLVLTFPLFSPKLLGQRESLLWARQLP